MRLPCPHCGLREASEFRYGGDATKKRPDHDDTDPAAWHDYYFIFDNPKGPHEEFWQHALGCRQWFRIGRDTATNEVIE